MHILDERTTRSALPMAALVEALRAMFANGCAMPVRHHHQVAVPGEAEATLLLMPAWQEGGYMGVKVVNVFPGNAARGLPAIHGSYMLMSARNGQMLAMVDGGELTARRTAAASALASSFLSRKDASRLAMIGTGRLSLNLIEAHAAVRPIRSVAVWGRSREKAGEVAASVREMGLEAEIAPRIEAAIVGADIVSCATLSAEPLVLGKWLQPGMHVDLVGAYRPTMRESDDEGVRRASVFVDTRAGATKEGGDIVQPLASGALKPADIRAELAELARGEHPGRTADSEITLFKSVGAALEDLAGAILAYETTMASNGDQR
jgi:alanine dehydrogenase